MWIRAGFGSAAFAASAVVALTAFAADVVEVVRVEAAYPGVAGARAEAATIPGGITVVDIEELEHRTVSGIADLLRYVPGVWAESDAGSDDLFFSSRGSNLDATDYDHNGVKLLQDGLPVTTADGNNHNRMIDPLTAQHATVARGANALAYGASTLGGAIDFVSPTAQQHEGIKLRVAGGSHGLGSTRLTLGSVFSPELDALVTLEGKTWEGHRDHNRQTRAGLYGNVGWRPTEALSTRLYGTYTENDQELPGVLNRAEMESDPDAASASAIGGHFQLDVTSWRLANKTIWQPDDRRVLEFGISLEEQSLFHPIVDRVLVDVDGAGPGEPIEVFSLLIDTDDRHINTMVRYRQTAGDHLFLAGINFGHSTVAGGHYRNDGGRRNGLTARLDNSARSLELFAFDRWGVDDVLMIEVGVQGSFAKRDTRSVDAGTRARVASSGSYSGFNPRFGIIYALSDSIELYGNVSRLYEPPTNIELEDDVRHDGSALDAMRGAVGELGFRGEGQRWYFDAALYYASIRNEILSVEDPAAPGTNLTTNVDETIHAGLELLLGGQLAAGPWLTVEPTLSVTANRFRFEDHPLYGDNRLPAAPEYALRGELMVRSTRGYYFCPTFDLVGARYADFANSYDIGRHDLLGLRLGWQGRNWHAFIEMKNLLDEEYVATHSVRSVAEADAALLNPGLPRSVYAGATMSF